jgi:putative N-acetyltransferase (TIGR04045 family)
MFEGAPHPYMPSHFRVKFATEAWEVRDAAALRRRVFCEEQGLFHGDDRDAVDEAAVTICAVSSLGVAPDEVVGTVRIHAAGEGTWWGSRLAVAQRFRRVGALGAGLIRVAVSSAHARGCTRFLAHVQARNVPLFHAMHWRSLEEVEMHGLLHHRMEADLAQYPPLADPATGLVTLLRRAA